MAIYIYIYIYIFPANTPCIRAELHKCMKCMHVFFRCIIPSPNIKPPPNDKTSPLLHIGTILGGFSIRGSGGFGVHGGRSSETPEL